MDQNTPLLTSQSLVQNNSIYIHSLIRFFHRKTLVGQHALRSAHEATLIKKSLAAARSCHCCAQWAAVRVLFCQKKKHKKPSSRSPPIRFQTLQRWQSLSGLNTEGWTSCWTATVTSDIWTTQITRLSVTRKTSTTTKTVQGTSS